MIQRHGSRQRRAPRWLDDYIVNTNIIDVVKTSVTNNFSPSRNLVHEHETFTDYTPCTYPYVISHVLKNEYVNFLANLSAECEPYSYEQAMKKVEWVHPMNKELLVLDEN